MSLARSDGAGTPSASANGRHWSTESTFKLWNEARDLCAIVSRTFFLDHPRAGVALFVGLLAFSPKHAAFALAAMVAARLAMRVAIVNREISATGMIELNAFFLGLAAATFFPSVHVGAAAALLGVALLVPVTVTLDRVLRLLDLPLSVAPYVVVFAVMWPGFSVSGFSGVIPASASAAVELHDLPRIALRGLGQIVFTGRWETGVAVLFAIALVHPSASALVALAALATTFVSWALRLPAWQTAEGLAVFTPVLVTMACIRKYQGVSRYAVLATVVIAPLLEAACLRVASGLGVLALSLSYVVTMWTLLASQAVRTHHV